MGLVFPHVRFVVTVFVYTLLISLSDNLIEQKDWGSESQLPLLLCKFGPTASDQNLRFLFYKLKVIILMQTFIPCASTVFSVSYLLTLLTLPDSYCNYPPYADRGDKGTKRLNNFPRITQLVTGRAGI